MNEGIHKGIQELRKKYILEETSREQGKENITEGMTHEQLRELKEKERIGNV